MNEVPDPGMTSLSVFDPTNGFLSQSRYNLISYILLGLTNWPTLDLVIHMGSFGDKGCS